MTKSSKNTNYVENIIEQEKESEKKSRRLLDKILKPMIDITRIFKVKTGWNNLFILNDEGIEIFAEKIANIKFDKTVILKESNDYIKQTIKSEFNVTKSKVGVPENNLERLIALVNENNTTKIINQFPTPDGGHIDLVYVKDDELNIIELKQWENGSNNPLYALVELIKNYKLLYDEKNSNVRDYFEINSPDTYKNVNLILLAPQTYYNDYYCEKSLKSFFKLIENVKMNLSKKINLNIYIKSIVDFSRHDFEPIVRKKIKKDYFTNNKYMLLDWKNLLQEINNIEQLKIEKWFDINSSKTWSDK